MMNVVTGAFGYIGRYITRLLLSKGEQVKTITTHPDKTNPFGEQVRAEPYNFENPSNLVDSLQGASTLYNTYWIRFPYGGQTFDQAVINTKILFECALQAGVKRVIHISVTNASVDSDLPYYAGKGQQEQALIKSGLSYAIVRPTLVYGVEDILVNNIAWLMRKFPIFPIFGRGDYKLQPIFVGDLAEIAVACSQQDHPITIDAVGVEDYTFKEFAQVMAAQIKPGLPLVRIPPGLGIALGSLIGYAVQDVLLTKAELQGLMDELLTSTQEPNGKTRFSQWLAEYKDQVGVTYTSELDRHFNVR